jgi:3-deoxy-D-manno-octulosonic-acid transferase
LGVYRALWTALSPAVAATLSARAVRGKEDRARLPERLGRAARPRPAGTLIWIHGASVGESVAALPLVSRLLAKPGRHVLVTTGTVTSAQLMEERLPDRAFHQYVPVDAPAAVRRFLDHWRPDLALFIESELWPNLLLETHAAHVPLALVNARMSERSFQGWMRAKGLARRLLTSFDTCLAQDQTVAARLAQLGARHVHVTGSLKADAEPLPVVAADFDAFRYATTAREILLAASTHPGEDEIILDATKLLQRDGWNGLSVIVPRHPQRGASIAELARERGFSVSQRSRGALPDAVTDVYIADTLGELGLFYRAATFAFLGGSLIPHGGQNPLEPALLGRAVLAGPHTGNFAETFETLLAAQASGRVRSAEDIAARARALFAEPTAAVELGTRAQRAAEQLGGALARTADIAETLLSHARA